MAATGNDILRNVWPEWEIVRRINSGSYGVVYEARRTDSSVRSRAAVKVITIPQNEAETASLSSLGVPSESTASYLRGVVDEFINEIQMMESLKGASNIVNVEDYKVVEKTDGIGWTIYIRMELLTPLKDHLDVKDPDEKEVIHLGCDICSALERCGKLHIIHRDIKPDNIFINAFGEYKLGDFGVARTLKGLTRGLSQKGTFNYVAPEIVRGDTYNETVDIYSLGIVLYWLMNKRRLPFLQTGRQPIKPYDIEEANQRRISGEKLPPPCEASARMAAVILRACDPDPKKRFASAALLKEALNGVENRSYSEESDKYDRTIAVRHAPPVTPPVTPSVTPPVRKYINVCSNARCRKKLPEQALYCTKCGSPAVKRIQNSVTPPGLNGDLARISRKSRRPKKEQGFFKKPGDLN